MRGTLAERFWAKVNKDGPLIVPALGPCWVWTASRTKLGYGKCSLGGQLGWTPASRVAFFLAEGHWPSPMGLHRCDYPPCCKAEADALGPAHIYEGDQKENMGGAADRGRIASGLRTGPHTHPERRPRGDSHGRRVLSEADVREIRARYAAGGVEQKAIAADYSVSNMTISLIVRGKIWRSVV
jgi:hypothetical protein